MAKTAPTIKPVIARYRGSHTQDVIKEYLEGAGQSFKAGEFVMFSSGEVIVATDGSKLLGIALSDATGTEGSTIPVQLLDPECEIIINLKDTASADFVITQAAVGAQYGIQVASNVWTLNQADTTGPNFVVTDIHPNYAVGDTNAWVYASPVVGKLYIS